MSSRRRPRWRHPAVLVVGAALVLVGIAAVVRLVALADDLQVARDHIDAAAVALEDSRIADARTELQQAQQLLTDANRVLYEAPELRIASVFPVAHQNIDALRDTVNVALRLSSGGLSVLQSAGRLESPDGTLEVPLRDGAVPLDAIGEAERQLLAMSSSLEVPQGFGERSRFVLGQISDAQSTIAAEVDRRRPQLDNLVQGLALVQELLGGNGDRRYLIAVANTAEMRGSGGMYLSYGVLESSGGDLTLGSFGNIDELFLTTGVDPASVGVGKDEEGRWEGLEPTRLWRNVNLIPSFHEVSPRAMAMYEAATGQPVDGVIQIDPAGLAAVLAGVGPVEVPEVGLVTADNVEALTLNEAYALFPDRDQRQEVLGDVAEAAFQRLVDGDYPSLRPLGEAIHAAVAERHLLFDSPRPLAQAPVEFFGANGPLPAPDDDYVLLTTQNRGPDKLDYYLETEVSVRGDRPAGATGSWAVDVSITNGAPAGTDEPAYVFGSFFDRTLPIGTYAAIVSLYVPNGTQLPDAAALVADGVRLQREGGRTVISWDVAVGAGETSSLHLDLTLTAREPGPYELHLVPIPRVHATAYDVQVTDGDGGTARRSGPLKESEEVVANTQ